MNISIFGLGYVGIVSAACLAKQGHNIVGVDVNSYKVDQLNKGISPIVEKDLDVLLKEGSDKNRIRATKDSRKAIEESDVSLISVGTPSDENGNIELKYVYKVCEEINQVVKVLGKNHIVIVRSTIFPGVTEELENILNKEIINNKIRIGFNPEFLREGSAVNDFYNPAFTVIGTNSSRVVDTTKSIYNEVDAPIINTEPRIAELIKYAANAWHATKINFANEIGRIGKSFSVDSRKVMEILVSDEVLNTSAAYMKPGFAYGGSCLPKDVRALKYFGKLNNVNLPLINSLSDSNHSQIRLAKKIIKSKKVNKVLLMGLSFKPGTDDLRESPSVDLCEWLVGKGYDLKIFDPFINESKLIGSNKEFINEKIPHLTKYMVENIDHLDEDYLLVISQNYSLYKSIIYIDKFKSIIDLVGLYNNKEMTENYEGLVW